MTPTLMRRDSRSYRERERRSYAPLVSAGSVTSHCQQDKPFSTSHNLQCFTSPFSAFMAARSKILKPQKRTASFLLRTRHASNLQFYLGFYALQSSSALSRSCFCWPWCLLIFHPGSTKIIKNIARSCVELAGRYYNIRTLLLLPLHGYGRMRIHAHIACTLRVSCDIVLRYDSAFNGFRFCFLI